MRFGAGMGPAGGRRHWVGLGCWMPAIQPAKASYLTL